MLLFLVLVHVKAVTLVDNWKAVSSYQIDGLAFHSSVNVSPNLFA
jgi:hypothetical protein